MLRGGEKGYVSAFACLSAAPFERRADKMMGKKGFFNGKSMSGRKQKGDTKGVGVF